MAVDTATADVALALASISLHDVLPPTLAPLADPGEQAYHGWLELQEERELAVALLSVADEQMLLARLWKLPQPIVLHRMRNGDPALSLDLHLGALFWCSDLEVYSQDVETFIDRPDGLFVYGSTRTGKKWCSSMCVQGDTVSITTCIGNTVRKNELFKLWDRV